MKTPLAYIAGYTDGDGCFFLRQIKNRKFQGSFIISSTSLPVLKLFAKEFGGKVRLVRQIGSHKAQYHFIKNGKEALEFVKTISNMLVEKKDESEIFIFFFETSDKQEKTLLIEDIKNSRLKGLALPQDKIDIEVLASSIKPSKANYAYLAGFVDAECCLGLQRYRRPNLDNWIYKAILQCNNTRSQSLKWLVSRFGGQIHFVVRKKYGAHHKNQLTWRLSSKSLAALLPKILPFLQTKKPVCEELIKFSKTIVPLEKTIGRNSPKFSEFYRPVLEERAVIFENVHRLNRKGV